MGSVSAYHILFIYLFTSVSFPFFLSDKAPVSKFIFGGICIGTGAVNFPLSNHKDWFTFNATDLVTSFSAINVSKREGN